MRYESSVFNCSDTRRLKHYGSALLLETILAAVWVLSRNKVSVSEVVVGNRKNILNLNIIQFIVNFLVAQR